MFHKEPLLISKTWERFNLFEDRGLRGFYFLLLVVHIFGWRKLLYYPIDFATMSWLWPWRLIGTPQSVEPLYFIFVALFLSLILTAAFPRPLILRLLSALLSFLAFAFAESFGKISHSNALWALVPFFFCLPYSRLDFGLWLARYSIFPIYVASGLWKLRSLFSTGIEHFASSFLSKAIPEHLASAYAEKTLPHLFLLKASLNHPLLSSFFWLAIIALQLSFIIPCLKPRYVTHFAFLAICFHLLNVIVLGVNFGNHITLIAWLFFAMAAENEKKDMR